MWSISSSPPPVRRRIREGSRPREPELIYKTKSNYNYYRSAGRERAEVKLWPEVGHDGKMVGGRGALCQLKLTNSSQFLAISLPRRFHPSVFSLSVASLSRFLIGFRDLRQDLAPGLSMSRYSSLTLIAPFHRSKLPHNRMLLPMYTSVARGTATLYEGWCRTLSWLEFPHKNLTVEWTTLQLGYYAACLLSNSNNEFQAKLQLKCLPKF